MLWSRDHNKRLKNIPIGVADYTTANIFIKVFNAERESETTPSSHSAKFFSVNESKFREEYVNIFLEVNLPYHWIPLQRTLYLILYRIFNHQWLVYKSLETRNCKLTKKKNPLRHAFEWEEINIWKNNILVLVWHPIWKLS